MSWLSGPFAPFLGSREVSSVFHFEDLRKEERWVSKACNIKVFSQGEHHFAITTIFQLEIGIAEVRNVFE